jgi:hypothetical protein
MGIGSRIRGTKKRLVIVSTFSLALTVATAYDAFNAARGSAGTAKPSGPSLTYRAPQKRWLADAAIRFTRLDRSQLSRVRITAADAAHVAIAEYGRGPRSHVTFESLGGYVDTSQIIHDWVGTTSWTPKALPAYFVRIHGVNRWPLFGGVDRRLSWCNAIVTASQGVVIATTCGN